MNLPRNEEAQPRIQDALPGDEEVWKQEAWEQVVLAAIFDDERQDDERQDDERQDDESKSARAQSDFLLQLEQSDEWLLHTQTLIEDLIEMAASLGLPAQEIQRIEDRAWNRVDALLQSALQDDEPVVREARVAKVPPFVRRYRAAAATTILAAAAALLLWPAPPARQFKTSAAHQPLEVQVLSHDGPLNAVSLLASLSTRARQLEKCGADEEANAHFSVQPDGLIKHVTLDGPAQETMACTSQELRRVPFDFANAETQVELRLVWSDAP